MSNEYQTTKDVPLDKICERLKQLSDAVTKGWSCTSEFSMRVPAECDRDADLVLSEAANRLEQLQSELTAARGQLAAKDREIEWLRDLLKECYPHVWSSAEAEHLVDGFRQRKKLPMDHLVDRLNEALKDAWNTRAEVADE